MRQITVYCLSLLLSRRAESFYMAIFFPEASRLYFKKKKKIMPLFSIANALHFHACCCTASSSPVRIHSSARNFMVFHYLFLVQWCYGCHIVLLIKYSEQCRMSLNTQNTGSSVLTAVIVFRLLCLVPV